MKFLYIFAILSVCVTLLFFYTPPPSALQTNYVSTIRVHSYQGKFAKPTPAWIKETTESELAFFKEHPITQRALSATYDRIVSHSYPRNIYLRRYRIIGEGIYVYGISGENASPALSFDGTMRTLAYLSDLPGVPNLPNVDFMVNHNDGMPMNYDPPDFWITPDQADQGPVFSGGKRADAPYIILMPHYWPIPSWLSYDVRYARCPWHAKKRAACWRGNINLDVDMINSPDRELLDSFARSPRCVISSLSLCYPDLIDAGFRASLDWIPSEVLRTLANQHVKGRISFRKHINYAYMPILDGVMISGGGYEWRLLSNSLVFKPDSPNVAWFEQGVKPYVHYLPVDGRLDDLVEKIHWAREHDAECENMANNGAAFAEENLMIEGLYYFMFRMFQEYEKCQSFNTEDLLLETEADPNWTRIR